MITQIEHTLPAGAWTGIPINECGQPLYEVLERPKLRLGYPEHIRGHKVGEEYQRSFLVRVGLLTMLDRATDRLPPNVVIVLIEGWRSMEHQQQSWERTCRIIQEAHPDWDKDKVEKKARLYTARPSPLSNHHCGGAVDVTLAYKDTGELLDMGTPYPHEHAGEEIMALYPMYSDRILAPHKENRAILRYAMQSAGFVFYPQEWWHYCFGDRMYSGYTSRSECIYGPIEPEPS